MVGSRGVGWCVRLEVVRRGGGLRYEYEYEYEYEYIILKSGLGIDCSVLVD